MQSILITGAASGVGKTTLITRILNQLFGWGAVKLTVTKEEGVCQVFTDPSVIKQTGKDTALFSEAGASLVVWIKASASLIETALEKTLPLLVGLPGVVWEGNSLLSYLKFGVVVFVTDGRREIKPSAHLALQKADFIILNQQKDKSCWLAENSFPFFFLNLQDRDSPEWLNFWQEVQRKMGGVEKLELEEKIKAEVLQALDENGKLSCEKAHQIADSLGVDRKEFGDVLNKLKIKLNKCQLGCF